MKKYNKQEFILSPPITVIGGDITVRQISSSNRQHHPKSDLPESVKHVLPSHAQDIYKEAFNSAWDQYKDKEDRRDDASREETAHKVAWAAVKHEYAKGDDDKWHKKS